MSTQSLLNSIRMSGRSRDDTIYCNPETAENLKTAVGSGIVRGAAIDDVMIDNMTVEPINGLDSVIICQRGDVFPLAKDWKNGHYDD